MEGVIMLLLLGIVPLALLVHLHIRTKRSNADQCKSLPPESMGWPVIGESVSYWRGMSNIHPRKFIDKRQTQYGEIFRSNLFGRKVVVSVDAKFNRFVMQNEERLFEARYPKSFVELIGKYGLLSVHGDLQRKLHGIAVNLFTFDKLKANFMGIIEDLLHDTFPTWTGREILLQDECHRMVLKLIAKQLLDMSPSKETDDICRLFHDFSAAVLSVPIKIPGSAYAKGVQARDFLKAKVISIIEERKEHPEVVHNDLLSKLMEEGSLSEEIIADLLLFLLFAGFETTSRSMAFTIKYLSDCPKALQQVIDEQDAIRKRKGNDKLTWDDYKSMTFTESVITETLRLGSVVPFLYRETKEDIPVKGYVIPKGWTIIAFLACVHSDEKHYPAALDFNPWRWNTSNQGNVSAECLTPFGGGARLCPGANLAKLEMSLFLHHFVTKYRWEVVEDDKMTNFPFAHLVKGFPIRVYPRESTHNNF